MSDDGIREAIRELLAQKQGQWDSRRSRTIVVDVPNVGLRELGYYLDEVVNRLD